jgi:putative NADH-flavin reductase
VNIIIFGASGATGHQLVKQALAQGHVVTAFVRNAQRLKIRHPHLKVIEGDVVNYLLVEYAIRDKDAVLSALGASSPFKYDPAIVNGVGNIIGAMKANSVRRFVYMSFAGVKESRQQAGFVIKYLTPKILRTEIEGHEERENMIKQSGLQWTIVRSPTLTNGKRRASFRSGENIKSEGFIVAISRADVAEFMLSQLRVNTFIRKAPLVMY